MTQPTHADLMARFVDLDEKIALLLERVGEPSHDGKGGTGIWGQANRTAADVAGLVAIRNQVIGAIAALSVFSVLIVLGVRQWIAGLFPPAH